MQPPTQMSTPGLVEQTFNRPCCLFMNNFFKINCQQKSRFLGSNNVRVAHISLRHFSIMYFATHAGLFLTRVLLVTEITMYFVKTLLRKLLLLDLDATKSFDRWFFA